MFFTITKSSAMLEKINSKLFFRNLCLCALLLTFADHAFAGMLEDGEDFSNNLASDIAPLLSLFGEQVTTQFMSQSTGWADCILLSMAPIGVITILVSAIRVGGPRWLKAIVGRVRENMVAAELEIMSSTSEESCELWNGQGVVKCQGASSIREFLCIYSTTTPDGRRARNTSQFKSIRIMDITTATTTTNKVGYPILEDGDSGINPFEDHPKGLSKVSSGDRSGRDLESGNLKVVNTSENQQTSQNGSASQPGSASRHSAASNEGNPDCDDVQRCFKSPAPGELIIVHNQDHHAAPNISLNCQADGHRQRVWAYAIMSVIIQAGVLIYFGFVTEFPTLGFEKDGRPVDPYAMPLAVAGTLLLVAGMLVCSHVVNKSTREKLRHVDKSTCAISHIWLQKEKRVSDQLFKSAAIYPNMRSYEYVTSERRETTARTQTAENRNALETLTTIGAFVSVLGIGAQFTGLRGMHWTAAITQLGAVILTAITRAVVRLHLAPHIKHEDLNPGFELDWFVTSLVASSRPPWFPECGKRSFSHEPVSASPHVSHDRANGSAEGNRRTSCLPFTIQTGNSRFSTNSASAERQSEGSYDELVSDIHAAQGILDLRLHLGKLGKWESPVSNQAKILFRAVEETLGFFKANFEGGFPEGSRNCAITMGAGPGKVSFKIALVDPWHASYDELDAALSVWVYSSTSTKQQNSAANVEKESHSMKARQHFQTREDDLVVNCPCIQVLGPSTEAMSRDLELWLPAGIVDDKTFSEHSSEKLDQMQTINIGHSGQWDERDSEEKSTNNKSPKSTVSDHDGQWEKQDNEGKRTRHQGPWKTVCSHEKPDKFYAKDMFSSFVWALAHRAALSSGGKPLGASVQPSDNQGTVKLKNRDISNLVQRIVDLGSWTRREVYLCLIPPLSSSGILPGARPVIDRTLELGVAFEKSQKWEQACEEYNKLRLLALELPSGSHARWKSLAILARFDARISKPGIRCFGSRRDDAYDSDEVSDVRDRIHQIFTKEKEKSDEQATSKDLDVRETLEEAFNIYDTFTEPALRYIALWDSSREAKLWRGMPEDHEDVAGLDTNHDRSGRHISKCVTFDRDIFDRTPLHHAMRTNVPTESQSLPGCHLKELKDELDLRISKLANKTNHQINWSHDFRSVVLDPATQWAKFMEDEADLKVLDLDHWTPLHYACHIVLPQLQTQETKQPEGQFGNPENNLRSTYHKRAVLRAKALIGRKVDVNAQGLDGTTPLHCAAANGCVELVELLVKHKANINSPKVDGTTPLHYATMSGCVGLVKFLLRHQATETTGSDGRTLLHMAAMTNKSAMFSWLNTNAEVKDQAGRTPLHLAAMSRAPASISELVDLGAKKDVKDHKGRTPLHLACMYDCPDSVEKLLEVDLAKRPLVYIDPNAKDEQGRTPLHLAALFDSQKAIKTLLKKKDGSSTEAFKYNVDFNTKDMEGRSPLHLAALSNALEALKLLVAHIKDGSGWPPRDEDGQTPFHLAAAEGSTEAIERMGKLMMERDLDPEAKSLLLQSKSDKFTAFSAAAHNGHVSSMKAFLGIHAKEGDLHGEVFKKKLLKMQDIDGDTPYMDALRNGLGDVRSAIKNMGVDYGDLWSWS